MRQIEVHQPHAMCELCRESSCACSTSRTPQWEHKCGARNSSFFEIWTSDFGFGCMSALVCSCTWNLKLSLFSVWIWIFHVMKVSAFDLPSPIWPSSTVLERSTEPEYSLRSATSSAQVPPRELKIRFFGFVTTTTEPLNETTWNVAVALTNLITIKDIDKRHASI